uniref:Uncharacterized protein n=1 Tax=Oryza punctata TaxID=4537 RepID=A0A0E0KX92_ORYPU
MAAMAMLSVQLTVAARPLRTRRALSVFTCAAPPRQRPPPSSTQHRRGPRRLRHDAEPPRKRGPPPPRPPARPQQSYTDEEEEEDDQDEEGSFSGGTRAAAMPKPPAGFVLDDQGRCIVAASKRIVTIIDDTNKRPLECIIRRVFRSTQDHECMLLCPVDMPVQVLKSANFSGWIAVDDDQIKEIIPSVAYALARHGVASAFLKMRFKNFMILVTAVMVYLLKAWRFVDGAHYMIYTPVDPLLFVAVKDKDGVLRIAEDELMDDPAVVGAIDEETEFTALVEEEEALLESVLGER